MVPCIDTQRPTLVAGTIKYGSGGPQGPTLVAGTINYRSRRPCDLLYDRRPPPNDQSPAAAKASTTYTSPYPYGSILRVGSPGLSTTKTEEYTQRHVSFLLSFRRAEHGSLVHKNTLTSTITMILLHNPLRTQDLCMILMNLQLKPSQKEVMVFLQQCNKVLVSSMKMFLTHLMDSNRCSLTIMV